MHSPRPDEIDDTMNSSNLDRILLERDLLLPSSGFAASVLGSLQMQAAIPIPFPWKRALPGIALFAVFALVRAFSSYGDAVRWQPLPNPVQSAMGFLNVQKYPPSLDYYLATFAVLLILYAILDSAARHNWLSPLRRFLKTYGEVPFFYYILHIWLIHAATLLVALATGQDWHIWLQPRVIFLSGPPPGWGFGLPFVYAMWAAVVLTLYLPCRRFSSYKSQHRGWWLSYL